MHFLQAVVECVWKREEVVVIYGTVFDSVLKWQQMQLKHAEVM